MSETNVKRLRQYGKAGYDGTRGEIYRAILAGDSFIAGSMTGKSVSPRAEPEDPNYRYTMYRDLGELPLEWKVRYIKDRPDYVVYSYRTPIAWHTLGYVRKDGQSWVEEHWTLPDVKYSTTTSRHQGIVRTALVMADYKETLED